jgi:hypothetical protein
MRNLLMAAAAVMLLSGHARAQVVATSVVCDIAPAPSLVVPVPATKAVFACSVKPATWAGTPSLPSGSPYTFAPSTGGTKNNFFVTLIAAVRTPETIPSTVLTVAP